MRAKEGLPFVCFHLSLSLSSWSLLTPYSPQKKKNLFVMHNTRALILLHLRCPLVSEKKGNKGI